MSPRSVRNAHTDETGNESSVGFWKQKTAFLADDNSSAARWI